MARLGQFRKDTLANWTLKNPILADGEFALIATNVSQPHKYNAWVCGDGSTAFISLPQYTILSNLPSAFDGNDSTIQLRRNTAANWTSLNPVLHNGEVGIETDTRKQKFGDGVTAWNSLPYSNTGDGVYDVTENNDGAVFASLSALLTSSNLNTLIPNTVRKGGMSIKFVQGSVPNSGNKYVQYRLMAQNFTTDTTQWQGMDDEPTAGSENLVKSGGVYDAIAAKSEMPLVDEDGFYVTDEDFNIGMKYDEEGFDTAKVSSHFIEVLKAAGISADDVMTSHAAEVNEDGFFIADESLNVGVKVDSNGVHAKNVLEYEII